MLANTLEHRVLALHPAGRGFGFVVLESPERLVDWGARAVPRKQLNAGLGKLAVLMDQYSPELLVLEKSSPASSWGATRSSRLIEAVLAFATEQSVRICRVPKHHVRRTFSMRGASTKQEIAVEVARQLTELAPQLPRARKPWMSEAYSMAIFEAAALALTYFDRRRLSEHRAEGLSTQSDGHATSSK